MKNVNKLTLTVLMIIGVFFYSCQNQEDFSSEAEQPISQVDTSKLIDFKGLTVNHRFSTPVEDLKIEYTKNTYTKLYQKAQKFLLKKEVLPIKVLQTNYPI